MSRRLFQVAVVAALMVMAAAIPFRFTVPAQAQSATVRVDPDDLGGVVTSSKGPEAGVWVIAETKDLPTGYFKIVVTDDQGRYLIPDLPRAAYTVWVRGYGLVDSIPVTGVRPGRQLNLTAVIAPSERDAAQYYPASYWFSLLQIPDEKEFPGTGAKGNGIDPKITSQAEFVGAIKGQCIICHQLGNKATREIPPAIVKQFGHGAEAWDRRVKSGQRGSNMSGSLSTMGRPGILRVFGDWTERVAKGELPPSAPPRPTGIERNFVVTRWAWNGELGTTHDSISTDKRSPATVNAKGKIYGVDLLNGNLAWVDPVENRSGSIPIPVRDSDTPSFAALTMPEPSTYWGSEQLWNSPANMHDPMMDAQGRVWMTSSLRPGTRQPKFCTDPSNPFAKYFPLDRSGRQTSYYDPKTDKTTLIDTCFGTHHLQFAEDKDNTLYFSGGASVVGWVKTAIWDQTHDLEKSQGWCPVVVDTNGDGKIGEYTNPDEPFDPTKDRRYNAGAYGIIPNPKDGSVWWADPDTPGHLMRLEVGNNPPATCRAEVYSPPYDPKSADLATFGYLPRGLDIDRDTGVLWTALAGTAALASFDRSKCKGPLNGPKATGDHCREGWTIWETPSGPQFKGMKKPGNAGMHYYNWVDQFNMLGLGKNVPIVNGSNDDALHALVNGKWVTIRVPYPIADFYTKGMDGRVDDPKTGWKGHGLYASSNMSLSWHQEGGKGAEGGVYHIQLRPDPLAK